jgi:hypothetical protein
MAMKRAIRATKITGKRSLSKRLRNLPDDSGSISRRCKVSPRYCRSCVAWRLNEPHILLPTEPAADSSPIAKTRRARYSASEAKFQMDSVDLYNFKPSSTDLLRYLVSDRSNGSTLQEIAFKDLASQTDWRNANVIRLYSDVSFSHEIIERFETHRREFLGLGSVRFGTSIQASKEWKPWKSKKQAQLFPPYTRSPRNRTGTWSFVDWGRTSLKAAFSDATYMPLSRFTSLPEHLLTLSLRCACLVKLRFVDFGCDSNFLSIM